MKTRTRICPETGERGGKGGELQWLYPADIEASGSMRTIAVCVGNTFCAVLIACIHTEGRY